MDNAIKYSREKAKIDIRCRTVATAQGKKRKYPSETTELGFLQKSRDIYSINSIVFLRETCTM